MYRRCLMGLLVCLSFSSVAMAGVSLDATRIIFTAKDERQGQLIGVTSGADSRSPYLVKAQVLNDVRGERADTPFVVTPSLFRLESGANNQLRILKSGGALPQDKESVFYFRVIAMPAGNVDITDAPAQVGGALTVSTGSVIKLFYRPQNLSMTQQHAMASLQFTQQGQSLKVTNPSPYFITLSSLQVGHETVALSAKQQNTMLAPFSSRLYPIKQAQGEVQWKAINDYGGTEVFHGPLH